MKTLLRVALVLSVAASSADAAGDWVDAGCTNPTTKKLVWDDALKKVVCADDQTGGGIAGYTLHVQALTSSPADGVTVYFGQMPKAPITTANINKVFIPKSGTIKRAQIYCYSGTAGTAENWSLNIRLNNTTDTLIETIGASASERIFNNESLNIAVVAGDYIEIKSVQPTWVTNPLTTIYGGYVYIE